MTDKLHEMIAGANSNNLFMQCDTPSLPYLKEVLPERDYDKIKTTNANQALLEAALLNELAEF